MTRPRVCNGIGAVIVGCGAAISAGCNMEPELESGYKVVLSRPYGVGDRARRTGRIQADFSHSITIGTRTIEDEYESIDLRFVVEQEIAAVSNAGEPQRIRFTVESMTASYGGAREDVVDAGHVIEAIYGTGPSQYIGLPASASLTLRLAIIDALGAYDILGPGDQDSLGPPDRVSVGDHWDIDLEDVRRTISNDEFSLQDADLSGLARLVDVSEFGGIDCLYVHVEIQADDVAIGSIPRGVKVDKSEMFFAYSTHLPLNRWLKPRDAEVNLSHRLEASTENGGLFTNTISMRASCSFYYPREGSTSLQ